MSRWGAKNGWVTLDDDSVWVRNADDFLVRIDRETERITADVTSGGDVIVVDGHVWTTAYDDAALFVLDPAG
jgi:streptogramin lyase